MADTDAQTTAQTTADTITVPAGTQITTVTFGGHGLTRAEAALMFASQPEVLAVITAQIDAFESERPAGALALRALLDEREAARRALCAGCGCQDCADAAAAAAPAAAETGTAAETETAVTETAPQDAGA